MKKLIFIFMTIALYGFAASEQYIRILSSQKTYSLDDTIEVSVIIVADHEITLDEMPKVKNLTLTGSPLTSTMQNYSYVNGVVSSRTTVTYKLTYTPLKVGYAQVGPIKIKSKGRLYVSNTLKLKIVKPKDYTDLKEDDFKYPFDPELFIAAKTDKKEVYIGEQIIVNYELYHRVDVNFAEQPVMPSYKNFWIEELDDDTMIRSRRKIYKGYYFKVTPIAKRALFPIKTGELILPPFKAKFKADIFSFGVSPNKIYKRASNLVKIKVKPLPEKGKPDDFPEGNVGNYSFSVSISKDKVKVNEPFTITLRVRGEGNIRNVVLPKLENIEGFKVYEPTEKVSISNKGVIRGFKSVSIVLKAEKPGKYKSFDLKFKYFDPKTEKYRVIDYSDLEITVTGSVPAKKVTASNSNTLKNDSDNEIADSVHKISVSLKPIIDNPGELVNQKSYKKEYLLFFFVLFIFPVVYLFITLYLKRKYRHISNKDIILMKNAYKKVISSLKSLEKKNPETKEFYKELHSIIITYIEEKFSIVAKGLTIEQIAIFLEEKSLKEEYIKTITDTLENCQYIRYSNIEVDENDKKNAVKLIKNTVTAIERGE